MYKIPKLTEVEEYSKVSNSFISNGTAYLYMSNENTDWKLSELSMNDTSSIAAKTLDPLFSNNFDENSKIGFILYNDQAEQVTLVKGHTKGSYFRFFSFHF